jgi:hypothetical protein
MGKPAPAAPADKVALYEKLVATLAGVERKGAAFPFTSLNGHMFSRLTRSGRFALRLPTEERDAFLKQYRTSLCEEYGSVLPEYVVAPDALLRKTVELKPYFTLSHACVSSFKPKATKKVKKPGKTG